MTISLRSTARDQLEGKIQERYGLAKDRARKDAEDWLSKMN